MKDESQIILYQTEDGKMKVQVKMDGETVWLTQDQMAELFEKGRSTVTEHIINIFQEEELDEKSVCREFRRTGNDGKEYSVKYYNLDEKELKQLNLIVSLYLDFAELQAMNGKVMSRLDLYLDC